MSRDKEKPRNMKYEYMQFHSLLSSFSIHLYRSYFPSSVYSASKKYICFNVTIFCTKITGNFIVTHLSIGQAFPGFSRRLTRILSMQSIVLCALTQETRANAATAAGGSTVTRLLANSAHFLCSGSDTVHHRIFLANVEWFKQIIHSFFS